MNRRKPTLTLEEYKAQRTAMKRACMENARNRFHEAMRHLGYDMTIFNPRGNTSTMCMFAYQVEARRRVMRRMLQVLPDMPPPPSKAYVAKAIGVHRTLVHEASKESDVETITPAQALAIRDAALRECGITVEVFSVRGISEAKDKAVWLMYRVQPNGLRLSMAQIAQITWGAGSLWVANHANVFDAIERHEIRMVIRPQLQEAA